MEFETEEFSHQQIALLREYKSHKYIFRPMPIAVFGEYEYLKTYRTLLYRIVSYKR